MNVYTLYLKKDCTAEKNRILRELKTRKKAKKQFFLSFFQELQKP